MRIILLALILGSCGLNSDHSRLAMEQEAGSSAFEAAAEQYTGRYAMRINLTTIQDLPIFGRITTVGLLYKIADIVDLGDELQVRERFCSIDFASDGPVTFEFSDATVRAIPQTSAKLSVFQDNGSLRLKKDRALNLIGFKLDDPANDAIPTDSSDPRIVDLKGDGNPGITAKISSRLVNGEIYLLQREFASFEVTAGASTQVLSGLANVEAEQQVIGASRAILNSVGSVSQRPHPDSSKNNVVMKKTADDADCEDIDWDAVPSY